MTDAEKIETLQNSLRAATELLNRKIDNHIRALKLDPNAKYILVISRLSGLRAADIVRLKLNEQFLKEMILVEGNVRDVIQNIEIDKK